MEEPEQYYAVKLYKNNGLVAQMENCTKGVATSKRLSFIEVLKKSPYCEVFWEEHPRATSWFGLAPAKGGASVYELELCPVTIKFTKENHEQRTH